MDELIVPEMIDDLAYIAKKMANNKEKPALTLGSSIRIALWVTQLVYRETWHSISGKKVKQGLKMH